MYTFFPLLNTADVFNKRKTTGGSVERIHYGTEEADAGSWHSLHVARSPGAESPI